MKTRIALFAAMLCLAVEIPSAWSQDAILLVGNSFTGGLKSRLRLVIRSSGRDATVKTLAHKGWTLGHHAASASSAKKLHSYPWTHVILQEQSDGIDVERYPDARTLDAVIHEIGASTIFFMTWPDPNDEETTFEDLRGVEGGDIGYVPIAFELDAALAPIGWAFREVLLEEPDADLWLRDNHHASIRGRYIATLVLFAVIYRESTVGLWPSPKMTPEQILHDQMLVDRVVLDHLSDWNLH